MALSFVAIDFETANGKRGSACSVGLVRITDGVVDGIDSFFIQHPRSLGGFHPRNIDVHGITPADVIGAPQWPEALERITDFIEDDYVVAHNASFDFSVIKGASDAVGISHPDMEYFCTLSLARAALRRLGSHKLGVVASALGLGDFKAHDAADDALMCALVCVKLAERDDWQTIEGLMSGHKVRSKAIGRRFY